MGDMALEGDYSYRWVGPPQGDVMAHGVTSLCIGAQVHASDNVEVAVALALHAVVTEVGE